MLTIQEQWRLKIADTALWIMHVLIINFLINNFINIKTLYSKVKVTSTPWTHAGGAEVWLHLFLTSILMHVSVQLHAPTSLTSEKNPVRIDDEAWWAPEEVWTFWTS
jgi:hypothetical protein